MDGHSLGPDYLMSSGRLEEARDMLELQIGRRDPTPYTQIWKLAALQARMGDRGQRHCRLGRHRPDARERRSPSHVPRGWTLEAKAAIHDALGDEEAAADAMELALAAGYPHWRLMGWGCGDGPSNPRIRRLLRGYPMC